MFPELNELDLVEARMTVDDETTIEAADKAVKRALALVEPLRRLPEGAASDWFAADVGAVNAAREAVGVRFDGLPVAALEAEFHRFVLTNTDVNMLAVASDAVQRRVKELAPVINDPYGQMCLGRIVAAVRDTRSTIIPKHVADAPSKAALLKQRAQAIAVNVGRTKSAAQQAKGPAPITEFIRQTL